MGLTAQQRQVAQLLVDNEFGLVSGDGKKLSADKIADMAGIARSTLFEWKKKPEFRACMNAQADAHLDGYRAEVYAGIMKLVRGGSNGMPSVKALDLHMRRFGLLTDNHVVQSGDEHERRKITEAERQAALYELDRLLDDEKAK